MSKQRPGQPSSPDRSSGGSPQRSPKRRATTLPVFVRVLISLLLVWHVGLVFLAPLSIPPSSDLVIRMTQHWPMQWYLDGLYLNHGYHFFAPDPGAGHLIRFEVLDERGELIERGEFPSRKDYWPRLRYHRYFMLADQADMDTGDNEEEHRRWQEKYLRAYARQLLEEYDGATARVQRVIHYPLFIADAREGWELDDPRTYKTELEVVERRGGTAGSQSGYQQPWQRGRQNVARGWSGGAR